MLGYPGPPPPLWGRSHVRVTSLVGCMACDSGMALPKKSETPIQSNPIQDPPPPPGSTPPTPMWPKRFRRGRGQDLSLNPPPPRHIRRSTCAAHPLCHNALMS